MILNDEVTEGHVLVIARSLRRISFLIRLLCLVALALDRDLMVTIETVAA